MVGWSKLNVHEDTYNRIEELKEEWQLKSQNEVIKMLLKKVGVEHERT